MCAHLYIYLIALSHQTNIIQSGQVSKEILNLTNLIGLQLFNPLLNKQNFLRHAISSNDGQNYLEKKHFLKNLIMKFPRKLKSTFVVCSAVWNHLSQVFNFLKPISGLFSIFLPDFQKQEFSGFKAPLLLPFYTNSSQIQ